MKFLGTQKLLLMVFHDLWARNRTIVFHGNFQAASCTGKRSRKVLMNNSFSFDGRSLRILLYKPVLSGLYIQEYFI